MALYGGFGAEDLSTEVNEGRLATVLDEGFSAKGIYPKDCCSWNFVINIRVHCNFF